MFYNNMGLSRWIEISKKHKPDPNAIDYLVLKTENSIQLLGWCCTKAQRYKPSNPYFFKKGCWYYPMGLITEVRKK